MDKLENWKLCRLCLNNENNSPEQQIVNIFSHNITSLPDKIYKCTSIQITHDDGLPSNICTKCINTITHFELFQKMCVYSNEILKVKLDLQVAGSLPKNIFLESLQKFEATLNDTMCKQERRKEISYREYNSDDDKTNSDYENDPNYRPEVRNEPEDAIEAVLSPPPSPRGTTKKRKKHKIRTGLCKGNIAGQEKVRIYKMDESMRRIIGENVYKCVICNEEFDSFFEYFDHQFMHDGQPVFQCEKCSEVFKERKLLIEHDGRHKIPCNICSLEVLPKSMTAHLLIHTDIHRCNECGMRHTSNASLEKHIKARHTGIKGFVCHVCGKQSSCQSSMNRHMAYHSNERPYKCQYCEFSAKSLNIVQVHTSRKHFAEKCVCEICAKIFKSQPSLFQHMKRIHTARKHICDICGKAFIERYNLTKHFKKHAGQRLHECKVCHREFFTVRLLKEHMHSHRQGCVNCPKCGKEFFYKKYFSKHVLKCTNIGNKTMP